MLKLFKNRDLVKISPSIVVFTVFFAFLLYFIFQIRTILIWLFFGFIIMVALHPLELKFEKWGLPRGIAIALTYILMLVGVGAVITIIAPPLFTQLSELIRNLQLPLPWLQDRVNEFSFNLSEVGGLIEQLRGSVGTIYSAISSAFTGVFSILTILVISLYLMIDRKRLHLRAAWFTKREDDLKLAADFLDSLEYQLGGWVRGQLISMTIIGVITYFGLTLIGVPYAAPLGLLAASLEILPNIGPTIAAMPSILIAWAMMGPAMALVTLLFYIFLQQLESNLVTPKIMQVNIDVSPLAAILCVLIGLELGGVIGALLAIPIYIVLRTIYSTWLKELVAK